MKSSKKAKNALLVSVVSIALCVALLIGATFAWFTDSVTNSGNSITAGTLDVELNPGDDTPLFSSENTLWEPGFSQKKTVTVSNAGNLWLQYALNFADVKVTTPEGHPDADITKVLDVYKVEGTSATEKDLTTENYLGTMADLMQAGTGQGGKLAPEGKGTSSETFTLVIKMKESADSQYMGAGVSFSVKVAATQASEETDGFGNSDYDQDAVEELPDVYVSDATQLQNAIDQAEGHTVIAMADGTYDQPITITGSADDPDKNIELKGSPNTVITGTISAKLEGDVDPEQYPGLSVDGVTLSNTASIDEGNMKEISLTNCTVDIGETSIIHGQNELEGGRSIKYTLIGNTFTGTRDSADPMMTWGSMEDGSVIADNTFGTETSPIWSFAFRPMNVDNGAHILVSNNTVYSYGYHAFAFNCNSDRRTDFTVTFENNTTYVQSAPTGTDAGFLWIQSEKDRETGKEISATLIFKGNNTYNGKPVTEDNIDCRHMTIDIVNQ